jgi:hypothetical protein
MAMVPLMLILDVLVVVSSLAAFLAIRDYQIRGGTPLSSWTVTTPVNRQSIRYPKGVLLAHIHSSLEEIRYESFSIMGTSDKTDSRGYLIISSLWPSHRRVELDQTNQGSP